MKENLILISAICLMSMSPWLPAKADSAVGMIFVPIPAGTFLMGSPASESGREPLDEIQHQVTITRAYEMQVTTVTQLQWAYLMGFNPSGFKSILNCPDEYLELFGIPMCPNNPVETVSLIDAQAFIGKLNADNHDGYIYRLPTEAEWEYAVRAGSKSAYYFGSHYEEVPKYAWIYPHSGRQTHPVGRLIPNAWGLYDMEGNVSQWVSDWYQVYKEGALMDPQGPATGWAGMRTNRGCGYGNAAVTSEWGLELCRSANRANAAPETAQNGLGFRLVRTR